MPSWRANGADHDGPFGQHDYEIIYGQAAGRLNRSAEVNIRAKRARPLNVGDVFTFGRDDGLWDAVVAEVTLGAGGAWNARCRMMEA
jgi:hypothetical protein